MSDLVSIIVPVYNTGEYLIPCLQSLCDQTYKNLEIILVDDGSTDGSGGICDEFARRDSRIRVIHQKNGGVSRARNHGLDMAAGEWILFVDSDDTIAKDYCAELVEAVQLWGSDAVIARPTAAEIPESFEYTPEQIDLLKRTCLAFDESAFGYNIDAPWGKLFRRSIIEGHHLRFPEKLNRSEDAWFCASFYEHAKRICCLNRFGYLHTERPGSLCRRFAPDAPGMLECILEENRAWVERNHPGEQSYLDALHHRVLPGIVECEGMYFLHESHNGSVWRRMKEYQQFLARPIIRRAIASVNIRAVGSKQLVLRLLLYRMGLGWLFFLLKSRKG